MPQYLKLRRKLEHGAAFVINQVGYHARKDDELLKWLAHAGLDVPVLANVFVLSPGAARVFHSGRIPGVVVTDELLELCQRWADAPDKGRPFFRELAAKQVAIARGLGFRGAYLGGHLKIEDYDAILGLADGFAPEDWRDVRARTAVPLPGRVPLLRARRGDRPRIRSGRSRVPRIRLSGCPAPGAAACLARLPAEPARP